jgi:hypothetical protein
VEAALRKKIATYNAHCEPSDEQRVVIYAGQVLLGAEAATEENE